jgi:poly-gamma-glutamate synthesis protein (capsule biosynthesis protein)
VTAPSRRAAALLAALAVAAAVAAGCTRGGGRPAAAGAAPDSAATATTVPATTTTTAAARPGGAAAGGPRAPSGRAVTLAFAGDTHFVGSLATRLARDPGTAIGPMAAVLRRADLAMVNYETAVTNGGTPVVKDFTFRSSPAGFAALRAAGIDVVTMANNHGEDYGLAGLRDSLAAARAAGFPVIGIGEDADRAFAPYRAAINGQRIAILAATQVLDTSVAAAWTAGPGKPGLASAYQVGRLVGAVRAARAASDTVVVFLHWGKESVSCPTPAQRAIARRLVAAGADVVVGSHAHRVLGAGWTDDGAYVDYGLGNFAFYHASGLGTRSGVLTLTVRGRAVVDSRWSPAVISGGVPLPLAGAAAAQATAWWHSLDGCTGLRASR